MTEYPYILFNKSPEQMRQLGACGGRANARIQRARRALVATPPEAVPPPALPQQTTAEDIHLLDTQFPWLRGPIAHAAWFFKLVDAQQHVGAASPVPAREAGLNADARRCT